MAMVLGWFRAGLNAALEGPDLRPQSAAISISYLHALE